MISKEDIEKKENFGKVCANFLGEYGIAALRAYGRHVGVSRATAKKKNEIIDDIIAIFCGELKPIERSKRGAPIRDDSFDPSMEEKLNGYRYAYLFTVKSALPIDPKNDVVDWGVALKENKKRVTYLNEDLDVEEDGRRKIHVGQLETLNKVSLLLPLDCSDTEKVVLSAEFVRRFNLREGDVISCYCSKRRDIYVATQILTIDGVSSDLFQRKDFATMDTIYPFQRIQVYNKTHFYQPEHKFTQWLTPLTKGQRALIVSAPKVGKTQYLISLARAIKELNPDIMMYALLIEQSMETVSAYRKIIGSENMLYTSYDDEADRQVFVATYLLKRAKCQVESGNDVILFVDSFSALAHAFNNTEESEGAKRLPNGLERKTLQYIKKYLGSACQMEEGGSLTIVGSASVGTGNSEDETIVSELGSIATFEMRLNDEMAIKHIFPALDFYGVKCENAGSLLDENEKKAVGAIRERYANGGDPVSTLSLLRDSDDVTQFVEKLLK